MTPSQREQRKVISEHSQPKQWQQTDQQQQQHNLAPAASQSHRGLANLLFFTSSSASRGRGVATAWLMSAQARGELESLLLHGRLLVAGMASASDRGSRASCGRGSSGGDRHTPVTLEATLMKMYEDTAKPTAKGHLQGAGRGERGVSGARRAGGTRPGAAGRLLTSACPPA